MEEGGALLGRGHRSRMTVSTSSNSQHRQGTTAAAASLEVSHAPLPQMLRRLSLGGPVEVEQGRRVTTLGGKVFAATAAGVTASATIAPVMTVLDLAIIRAQFANTSFAAAVGSVGRDLLAGRMMWKTPLSIMNGVYASTYLTANYTKTACEELGVDYKVPVATATSLVNVTAIALKDRAYASLTNGRAKVFPLTSYALFALRDGLTITSSFVVKNVACQHLEESYGMRHRDADLAASFAVPMAAQLLSTPFHILSLDVYSRPQAALASRAAEVARGYAGVCSGRVMRIIPAFGVGGWLNSFIQEKLNGEARR